MANKWGPAAKTRHTGDKDTQFAPAGRSSGGTEGLILVNYSDSTACVPPAFSTTWPTLVQPHSTSKLWGSNSWNLNQHHLCTGFALSPWTPCTMLLHYRELSAREAICHFKSLSPFLGVEEWSCNDFCTLKGMLAACTIGQADLE